MWDKREYPVSQSEFDRRLANVAAFAAERQLAGVVVYSAPRIHQWSQTGHVGYLTNWSNLDRLTDVMIIVPCEGEAVMLVAGVEYMIDQITEVSWLRDVRLVSSPDLRAISGSYSTEVAGDETAGGRRTFGQEAKSILAGSGLGDRPIAVSGYEAMPAAIYQDLQEAFGGRIDGRSPDIVADLRSTKSPSEVELLRQTAHMSDRCYATMMDVLTDGMMGYELTAEMDRTASRLGADLVYHCVHSAPGGDLHAGKLSIKSHDCPLHTGDYINVNAYVVHRGYWIQNDRCGTIGHELSCDAVAANLEVQDEILRVIRPGLKIGNFVRLSEQAAERRGYTLAGGRIGHGQGLDYSEQPFLMAGSDETLKVGHVFVLHVCLGLPDTNILLNPIADLCHVTHDGVEVLNEFPRGYFYAS